MDKGKLAGSKLLFPGSSLPLVSSNTAKSLGRWPVCKGEGLPLRSSCPRLPAAESHCSVTMSVRTARTWSNLQEHREKFPRLC